MKENNNNNNNDRWTWSYQLNGMEVEVLSLSIKPWPRESRQLLMTILAIGMYLVMEIFPCVPFVGLR